MLTARIAILLAFISVVTTATSTIVATFILRDEDVNLKVNLPLWTAVVDYFVFLVDRRTVDASVATIQRVLTSAQKNFVVEYYDFEGFGQARTRSLELAWKTFSNASHVLIVDPDWKPELATIRKSDLDLDHDVFRFTVFDRNGVSRRRMDWLLRHRPGLKMRYHLHEVLDVGMYQHKELDWVAHEIEQSGSWHTTVGHGNSTTLKRFEFDIALLLKDLKLYGDDPHTDYYLGTTYHGLAERYLQEQGVLNDTVVDLSIHFLKRRLVTKYAAEFSEERWGCMYLLGGIYSSMKKDYANSVHWLSLCRDFNPKQAECSIALTRYYYLTGAHEKAIKELEQVLKHGHEDRVMLNMLNTKECAIPQVAIEVMILKARGGLLSLAEAKYLMLLGTMIKQPQCGVSHELIMKQIWEAVRPIFSAAGDVSVTTQSKSEAICAQPDVQNLLFVKKYKAHPCQDLARQLSAQATCSIFQTNLPPANEELQIGVNEDGFVGAANVYDIAHHVLGADLAALLRPKSQPPLRILFAQYFNPSMLYNLLGHFHRLQFDHFEIVVVVSEKGYGDLMQNTAKQCGTYLGIQFPVHKVKFVFATLFDMSTSRQLADLLPRDFFDYIEYNGGLSMSPHFTAELRLLQSLLTTKGSIGLTYFANNVHVRSIREQIRQLDEDAMKPFSMETKRLIDFYLEAHKMESLQSDRQLMTFLGAEPAVRQYPPNSKADMIPAVNWTALDMHEVAAHLHSAGLTAFAWLPTAYSKPYDRIPHYQVQKFRAAGLPQSTFISNYLTLFRYTCYVVKTESTSQLKPLQLSAAHFLDESVASTIRVVDRLGSLGASFAPLVEHAKHGFAGYLGFAPYAMQKFFTLDHTSIPAVAPSLALISKNPTLADLLRAAKDFQAAHSPASQELSSLANSLLEVMELLQNINAITLVSSSGPIDSLSHRYVEEEEEVVDVARDSPTFAPDVKSVAKSPAKDNTGKDYELQARRMRELGFDEEFIREALEGDDEDDDDDELEAEVSVDATTIQSADEGKHDNNRENEVESKLAKVLKVLQETSLKKSATDFDKSALISSLQKIKNAAKVGGVAQPSSALEDGEDAIEVDSSVHEGDLLSHYEASKKIGFARKTNSNSQHFRGMDCWTKHFEKIADSKCLQPKPVRRRTAAIQSSSYLKITFDLIQLVNIKFELPDNVFVAQHQALQSIKSFLKEKAWTQQYKALRLTHGDIERNSLFLNRAVAVYNQSLYPPHRLLHWGAVNQLKEVSKLNALDKNDFIVLDVILQQHAMRDLYAALVNSSVWFDVTNGAAFVSHHDDGLQFPNIMSLAQQLALGLSASSASALQISKFYALTMPANVSDVRSAVTLANRNEIVAIMWLDQEEESPNDGVRIFDAQAADCLFAQGVSFYPSVHPDFLSKGGDLSVDIMERCGNYRSETIPRVANRLVLIKDRMPFYFISTRPDGMKRNPIAIVFTFLQK